MSDIADILANPVQTQKDVPRGTIPQTPPKPEGWWSIAGLPGTREGVANAVRAASSVPEAWKSAIVAEIAALPPEFNLVHLDCHRTGNGGRVDILFSLVPSKGLV